VCRDKSEIGTKNFDDRFVFQCSARERQVFTLAIEHFGHEFALHEPLLVSVVLNHRKAVCRGHPMTALSYHTVDQIIWPLLVGTEYTLL
jgi:hypothetical protein